MKRKGFLRLYAGKWDNTEKSLLYHTPNLLTQLFQGPAFTACTKLEFLPEKTGDMAGVAVLGNDYAAVVIENSIEGNRILLYQGTVSENGSYETRMELDKASENTVFFRVTVSEKAVCTFSYSFDGECFIECRTSFTAVPGRWVGAKLGIFARNALTAGSLGCAEFDWFKVEKQ
jgi:beta-xylosidase